VEKGKSAGKISFSLSLSLFTLDLSLDLDLLAAVRGKEIFESRARSFEKERVLDR
jgi:hypothetical protein